MKVTEIITNPPRDEYLDAHDHEFRHAAPVATIRDLTLKKHLDGIELRYGLFDKQNRLVGYFGLIKYKPGYTEHEMWQVELVQLAQAYKGMGYGTFLYDYAIMNDKLRVLSDETNTGGPHGSRTLWTSLWAKQRYNIVGYDTETGRIIDDIHPAQVYDQTPNMRWLAIPPAETINEAISRIQANMKNRHLVWYGPGTTYEDYFNY